MKENVLIFLESRTPKLCVFSTASINGKPESALMTYVVRKDGTFLLVTHKETRKVLHVRQNPQVSLVIGWGLDELNIQCDGIASLVEQGEKYEECASIFHSLSYDAKKFISKDAVFIAIKPIWIRIADFSTNPHTTEEIVNL
jgi:general stress protein 26